MVLFPLKDGKPLTRIPFQYVTVALMGASIAAFLWQISPGGEDAAFGLSTIPAVLLGSRELAPELVMLPAPATLLTSMFLHGGWMHLGGNMLYLWIFGDNVEDAMGHVRFAAFYVVCGIVGGLAHVAANPDSIIPTLGASGAISGVLGAYLVLHPTSRVWVLVFMRFPVRLPAYVVLGAWIGLQLFNSAADAGGANVGGTAWWAHIGGFAAGALLVVPLRHRQVPLFDGLGPFAPTRPGRRRGGSRARRRPGVPDSGRKR